MVCVCGRARLCAAVGTAVKFNVADGSIGMYATFPSTAGSSVSGIDGDASGNMFIAYRECVPCVSG